LLDECERKESYLHCRMTGLAVRKQDYATFKKGPYFRPLVDGTFLCPLCCTACLDTDADWNHHLCYECTQNQRIYKYPLCMYLFKKRHTHYQCRFVLFQKESSPFWEPILAKGLLARS